MEESCPRCGAVHPLGATCSGDTAVIGEVLGDKYRITRLIGRGGMGAVYEAQHVVVGRRFAVKLLHPEIAKQRDMLARFEREAQTAGTLESEHIAAAVDFGRTPQGLPFIVMELLQGEDLGHLMSRDARSLTTARVVGLMLQVARGLELAHGRGIVHRDLKPENVFVCRRADGSDLVKLLDFGIAKLQGTDTRSSSVTRTGTAMGTPYYMAPEQARGEKALDHRVDIYALGVMLYELLSGQKPHPGDSYNAIISHILMQEPQPLEKVRPELPAPLTAAIHRALSKDQAQRQASVTELADALAPYSTTPSLAALVREPRAPNLPTLAPTPARVPRRGAALAGLGALGVAAAGALIWIVSPQAAPSGEVLSDDTTVPKVATQPRVFRAAVVPEPQDAGARVEAAKVEAPKVETPKGVRPRPVAAAPAAPAHTAKPAVQIDPEDPYGP
jgi:serine/threonine-protein kinase